MEREHTEGAVGAGIGRRSTVALLGQDHIAVAAGTPRKHPDGVRWREFYPMGPSTIEDSLVFVAANIVGVYIFLDDEGCCGEWATFDQQILTVTYMYLMYLIKYFIFASRI